MSTIPKNILSTIATNTEAAGLTTGMGLIVYLVERSEIDPIVRIGGCIAIAIAVGWYAHARAIEKKAALEKEGLTQAAATWKTTAARYQAEKNAAEKRAAEAEALAEQRKQHILKLDPHAYDQAPTAA